MASLRRPGFGPRVVQVGFLVETLALGQIFLQVRRLLPVGYFASSAYSCMYQYTAFVTYKIFKFRKWKFLIVVSMS